MIRLFPKIPQDDLIVRLFHRAVAAQWSSDDIDWDAPLGLSERETIALTRIITPVYLGEQSAMNGASLVLPQLIRAGETSAQLYLSTFLLDEARHFEALTRLYTHVGSHPLQMREMPAMLKYHHRLQQGDRVDWLWGILISDLFAREFYLTFAKVQPGALFGQMSTRILRDESRHQAFAHAYLKSIVPGLTDARRIALIDMKDELLLIMEEMNRVLRPETDVLHFDADAFFKDLIDNIQAHASGIGLGGPGSNDDDPGRRFAQAPDWAKILAAKRRESMDSSSGVRWPGARTAEPGGDKAAAEAAYALTEADLEFLVGPLHSWSAAHRPRRLFTAAHPLVQLARCTGCAVAALCRTPILRAAAAHA